MRLKLRRIGNSLGVLFPKDVITGKGAGDEVEVNVITDYVITGNVITEKEVDVITEKKEHECVECGETVDMNNPEVKFANETCDECFDKYADEKEKSGKKIFNTGMCKSHEVFKGTCECK